MCNAKKDDIFAGLESVDVYAESAADTAAPAPIDMAGRLTTAADAKRYILAGRATITLRSVKSGQRFTYRINAAESGDTFFVGLLTGPNNFEDYKYLGRISREIFWLGRKVPRPGDIARDAPSAKAFDWSWRQLVRGILPDALEVWHEGACGRCGRRLTVPESIASGFGPECITKIGF
jgi:Family of unknown function (DUF6011)